MVVIYHDLIHTADQKSWISCDIDVLLLVVSTDCINRDKHNSSNVLFTFEIFLTVTSMYSLSPQCCITILLEHGFCVSDPRSLLNHSGFFGLYILSWFVCLWAPAVYSVVGLKRFKLEVDQYLIFKGRFKSYSLEQEKVHSQIINWYRPPSHPLKIKLKMLEMNNLWLFG